MNSTANIEESYSEFPSITEIQKEMDSEESAEVIENNHSQENMIESPENLVKITVGENQSIENAEIKVTQENATPEKSQELPNGFNLADIISPLSSKFINPEKKPLPVIFEKRKRKLSFETSDQSHSESENLAKKSSKPNSSPNIGEIKIDKLVLKSHQTLCTGIVVWCRYSKADSAFYPAVVREVLDIRSKKIKVSFCDLNLEDKVVSVNKADTYMISDLPPGFPVLAKNIRNNKSER
jgi:hypothetical protein